MGQSAVLRRSHPVVSCVVVPGAALLIGGALAVCGPEYVREQVHQGATAARPGWYWWMGLLLGAGIGIPCALPQRHQLRRHRDFLAERSLRGSRRTLEAELQWLRVLWPMGVALAAATGVAWLLGCPMFMAQLGVCVAPVVLWKECRSIHTLARRKGAGRGQP